MIRYAKKEELVRINELRKQVFDIHAKGRPDMCRDESRYDLWAMEKWRF